MYNDFENTKLKIELNPNWILLTWHEYQKLIETQEQLFDILHSWRHDFSEDEIENMSNHMWISDSLRIEKILEHETWNIKKSRSWGHWWQNVNKVETKIQLFFDIVNSKYLTSKQKEIIIKHAHTKQLHHDDSIISFECQEERNQEQNLERAKQKLKKFLHEALEEDKERISTQVPKHEKEKRLDEKKKHGQKKSNRNFTPEID